VYARRQFCGNLEVHRPPEPLWNPRLREAATTLGASGGDSAVENRQKTKVLKKYPKKITLISNKYTTFAFVKILICY